VKYFSWLCIFLFVSVSHAKDCAGDLDYYAKAADLYQKNQHLLSALHFSHVALTACDTELKEKAKFFYALNMSELGENSEALESFQQLSKSKNLQTKKRADIGQGLLGVPLKDADVALRVQLWNERHNFSFLQEQEKSLSSSVRKEDLYRLQNEWSAHSQKNLWAAGISSAVVPGLGQAYVGAYQSAALSFVLNALFISATIELHNKGLDATAVAAGAAWSVVYLGNIINAVDSAKKYNLSGERDWDRDYKKTLFPEIHY
jgi:hypothetical protein